MVILLESMFDDFCKYLDGRVRWSDREERAKNWTTVIFSFFDELNKKETIPFIVQKEFMRIDYLWRYDSSHYSINEIELAVENENMMEKVHNLMKGEIQHLIDIKARNKVGIFYIPLGDENEFIVKIKDNIGKQNMRFTLEKYLIILVYATTSNKKRAMLLKGFFFDEKGQKTNQKEKIVYQAG